MGGDHDTGRIVTVSNAYIFKEPLYNYSRHINYIWDEITIPVTYESDWKKAIEIMSSAEIRHQDHIIGTACLCAPYRQLDRTGPHLPGGYRSSAVFLKRSQPADIDRVPRGKHHN